jgi:hypothetical protein
MSPVTEAYVIATGQFPYMISGDKMVFCNMTYSWSPLPGGPTGVLGFSLPENIWGLPSFANFGAYSGFTGAVNGIPLVGVGIPTDPPNASYIICFTANSLGMSQPATQDNLIPGASGTINMSIMFDRYPYQ